MKPIELSEAHREKIGPEMKMDVHWIDVQCTDGRKYYGLVVRGGRYITGFANNLNGEEELPFGCNEIQIVRRKAPSWWPFW